MSKNNKKKKNNFNNQLNKAIATTVVVTAIGISTINSLQVKAGTNLERNTKEETHYVGSSSASQNNLNDSEVLTMEQLVTKLLKEGNYKEAREIRKSFSKYTNPLARDLRSLDNYAVNDVG